LAHTLAHQGGWDEIALVAAPIVVIIALLALVKRRVDATAADVAATASTPDDTGPTRTDR
jgi:hypothetical protein